MKSHLFSLQIIKYMANRGKKNTISREELYKMFTGQLEINDSLLDDQFRGDFNESFYGSVARSPSSKFSMIQLNRKPDNYVDYDSDTDADQSSFPIKMGHVFEEFK